MSTVASIETANTCPVDFDCWVGNNICCKMCMELYINGPGCWRQQFKCMEANVKGLCDNVIKV